MSVPINDPPPRYLRTPDAARFVGLSIRTLEKHRIYGTARAIRNLAAGSSTAWTISRRGLTRPPRHLLPIPAPQLCCPPSVKVHSFRRPGIRLVADSRHAMSAQDRPQFKVSPTQTLRALAGNPKPCAAQRVMEYPFFGLAKTRRTMPIIYGFKHRHWCRRCD